MDIESTKVDIEAEKVDIERIFAEKASDFSVKTVVHIHRLFEKFGYEEVLSNRYRVIEKGNTGLKNKQPEISEPLPVK